MGAPLPKFGEHSSPLHCGRLLRWPDESSRCPQEAAWHVIWSGSGDNGLACEDHYQVARADFAFFAAHPFRMECQMPGARYLVDENVCVVDEHGLGLARELVVSLPTEREVRADGN